MPVYNHTQQARVMVAMLLAALHLTGCVMVRTYPPMQQIEPKILRENLKDRDLLHIHTTNGSMRRLNLTHLGDTYLLGKGEGGIVRIYYHDIQSIEYTRKNRTAAVAFGLTAFIVYYAAWYVIFDSGPPDW